MANSTSLDLNIPITWLVSGLLAFAVSMGGVYFQLNSAIASIKQLDTKMEVRDERITDLIRDYERTNGILATHSIMIKANEDRVIELIERYRQQEQRG